MIAYFLHFIKLNYARQLCFAQDETRCSLNLAKTLVFPHTWPAVTSANDRTAAFHTQKRFIPEILLTLLSTAQEEAA